MSSLLRLPLALVLLAFLSACGRKEAGPTHAGGHMHVAPHGGSLVEIGAHAYNLELLRDQAAGKLTVWVLDGHAENFIRLKAGTIEAVAAVGADQRPLTLKGVASTATGETAGDTSQFEVQADWLKSAGAFKLTIPALEIRGTKFGPIVATFVPPTK